VYILLIMSAERIPNEKQRIAAIPATCISSHLRKAARSVNSLYDDLMRQSGLYANQVMMLIPPYLGGPISISKMAEYTGLDRTTLVRNLKPLEKQGFVTIKTGRDQRMRIVELTPKGLEALIVAVPLWEEAQRRMLDLLGAQHSELMATLSMISEKTSER
jgi:DNA-binding MarR family transcriptional regulator